MLNVYVANKKAKYTKQKLIKLKRETETSTRLGEFNIFSQLLIKQINRNSVRLWKI